MDDNNWNQSQVAEYFGVSRVRISQVLKVLKLNQEQLENVKQDGRIVSSKIPPVEIMEYTSRIRIAPRSRIIQSRILRPMAAQTMVASTLLGHPRI